jgi:hypothetical protein
MTTRLIPMEDDHCEGAGDAHLPSALLDEDNAMGMDMRSIGGLAAAAAITIASLWLRPTPPVRALDSASVAASRPLAPPHSPAPGPMQIAAFSATSTLPPPIGAQGSLPTGVAMRSDDEDGDSDNPATATASAHLADPRTTPSQVKDELAEQCGDSDLSACIRRGDLELLGDTRANARPWYDKADALAALTAARCAHGTELSNVRCVRATHALRLLRERYAEVSTPPGATAGR